MKKRFRIKKLNEDVNITDPQLAQQYAVGMQKLAKYEGDIASLKAQISKIEKQKSDIQNELAKISAKAAPEQEQQDQDTTTVQVTGQKVEGANESLNENRGEYIVQKLEELEDKIVYLRNSNASEEELDRAITEYNELEEELRFIDDEFDYSDLHDPQDDSERFRSYQPGDNYDIHSGYDLDEDSDGPCWKGYEMIGMKKKNGKKVPNCVPESLDEAYASKFRPGKMKWKGKTYFIDKVENVNDKLDIIHVDDKMLSSKHLETTGAEMIKKPRQKRMTKREYERTLKDVMSSLVADQDDVDFSIIADQAETLLYDPELVDYLERKWKKENHDGWYTPEPKESDLKELLMNDLQMFETFTAKKNFRDLIEAYVERVDNVDDDYLEEEYVLYVKIIEDGNEFIGKIFKISPDGDWYGTVKEGDSDTFQKISYDPSYEEDEIIDFLSDTYDEVEILSMNEFNEYIEDEYNDEEMEETWPANTVASSGPPMRR